MLTIRLTRVGKKKEPFYRLIISDKRRDPWGHALEILGSFNPKAKERVAILKTDRIKYWLSVGAQTSSTVHNLFVDQKILDEAKIKNSKAKPGKKKALLQASAKKAEPVATPKEEVKTA